METDIGGKRAFRTVNQSKFVFSVLEKKTKLVMERGRLRKKERRHTARERGQGEGEMKRKK